MRSSLRQFFSPPFYQDENKYRLSWMLNAVLWVGLVVTALFALAGYYLPPEPMLSIPLEVALISLHILALLLCTAACCEPRPLFT